METGRTIEVARDSEGLKLAFLELLEEAAAEPRRQRALRTAQHAANSARLKESLSPARALSQGYYSRAEYLFWLRQVLDLGITMGAGELRADELAGLATLDAARGEFERTHPRCSACGAPNPAFSIRCGGCGEELKARAKK